MPTNTSIPISQLTDHPTILIEDYIALVNSSSMTTMRASIGTLNIFFAESGSNLSASFTSQSFSNSYAINADTASYVEPILFLITSSWTENLRWTAVVGTASLAYNANTASRLEGIGSSYENAFSVNSLMTVGDQGYVQGKRKTTLTSVDAVPDVKYDSVFFNKDFTGGGLGYSKLFFFDDGTLRPKMVFDIGSGSIDPTLQSTPPDVGAYSRLYRGFLFLADSAGSGGTETGSLLFIRDNGRVYAKTIEGQDFSSSISTTQVGFVGTASYAMNTSFSLATPAQWPLDSIVMYAGSAPLPLGWDTHPSSSVNMHLKTYAVMNPLTWMIETSL